MDPTIENRRPAGGGGVWAYVLRDWGFYAFILAYGAVVGLIAVSLGEADKFVPLIYLMRWSDGLLLAGACAVGVATLKALPDPEPMARLKTGLRALAAPEVLAGVLLFLALALFYGVFTSMKAMLPDITPFRWDPYFADLDAFLHGGDPWLWLRVLDPLTNGIQHIYGQSWFLLLALTSFLVCVWPRLREVRAQYLWTFMLTWSLLGSLLAGVFMSAGPIFYEQVVGEPRFAGLTAHLGTLPEGSPMVDYPKLLWTDYSQDRSGFGSGISAFPSMHLAMATLFALLAFRIDRRLGWLAMAYLALIMVGSVHLGWHYAVDGYFSILATVAIWKLVGSARNLRVFSPTGGPARSRQFQSGRA